MQELSSYELSLLMKRFPTFELSYETISHKKVSNEYDICMAIPLGKKAYAWFTFKEDRDVCYILELNKEKRIFKGTETKIRFDNHLSLGTILYGSIVFDKVYNKQWFVVEDIFFYKGISMKKTSVVKKFYLLEDVMKSTDRIHEYNVGVLDNDVNHVNDIVYKNEIVFMLPFMWYDNTIADVDIHSICNSKKLNELYYNIHHIQYRCSDVTKPYLNVNINKKINTTSHQKIVNKIPENNNFNQNTDCYSHFETVSHTMDYSKPQYKYPTVFQVTADIQFDIYHLFSYGKNKTPVYYNVAYVPNYKKSVFLNGLFRNIKENSNLDCIEESDDEEDFQNMREDKYVDIKKVLLMECVFHTKFKKWIPMKVVNNNSKVVHINNLVKSFQ
jgi:hypothetical protein